MPRWQLKATTLKIHIEELGRQLVEQTQQRGQWRLAAVALELLPLEEKLRRAGELLASRDQHLPAPLPHLDLRGLPA